MPFLFDPLSEAFSQDPYSVYRRMREADRPYFFEEQGMFLLSRYEDVVAVATDPQMVRSLAGIESAAEASERQRRANWHDMPFHERVVQFSLLDSDGEIHRRLRRQIFGEFSVRSVSAFEPVVQAFVDQLLDKLSNQKEIDFTNEFAAHVPGFVIGHLLGAPAEDSVQLRLWSERVVQYFDVDRSDERKLIAETASREFFEYLTELKRQRQKSPKSDLISKMIADEVAGFYSEDEFISTCMLILMAGHGSTIDVLGSGMHTLLNHPRALKKLRADPSAIPNAIQEMFRYEPPLPFFHRHALRDIKIGDHHYKAGTTFGLLYGAANRDPRQFDNADHFDIERSPNRHLAFGLGAHLCLGNNLARLNMKVIFETLLKRFATIELANPNVEYKRGLSVRGPKELPLIWR